MVERLAVARGDRDESGAALLDRCLEQIEWWDHLEGMARRRKRPPSKMRIIIAADMSFYESQSPSGVDPALVEHLLDAFYRRGFTNSAVGSSVAEEDQWYENRDARALADLVGYRYVTGLGFAYSVESFSEALRPARFGKTSVLRGSPISRHWADADVRVNFAKNKTHDLYYYALALYNLLGVLPALDKRFHYGDRLPAQDVARDLLTALPPHLTLLDAVESCHGPANARIPKRLRTDTVIASTSVLLLDWVGALKMGIDPYLSPLNAPALRRMKLPERYEIAGDVTVYQGWQNVSAASAELAKDARRTWSIGAIVAPLIRPVDHEIFPHKNPYADRANALIAESEGWSYAAYTLAALLSRGLDTWRTLFRKDLLKRIDTSLGLDLEKYTLAAYEAVERYFDPYERLIDEKPLGDEEIRIRQIEGANLFAAERHIEAPFDDFVQRVEIARAIRMMNDYIGGRAVTIAADARGRVTHQAERNVYVVQPNYLALYGGEPIDVTKLEYIKRSGNRHRIVWRTIRSENDSAETDDGSVTFTRTSDGTAVRIVGLQKFRLPPAVEAARYDLLPEYLGLLTTAAYRTYVEGTIANFEAVFAGEDPRIGHDLDPRAGEDGSAAADAFLTSLAERAVTITRRIVSEWRTRDISVPGSVERSGETADELGFHHGKAVGPE